jgi:hypothetical protein
MTKIAKRLALPALLAAGLLPLVTVGGPAMAATSPAAATVGPTVETIETPLAADPSYFLLQNAYTNDCIQEDGTTGAVYGGSCPTGTINNSTVNHSVVWYLSSASNFNIDNEHSGYCITADGTDSGLYMSGGSCTNDSQEWNEFEWLNSTTGAFTGYYGYENVHSGYILTEEASTGDIEQIPLADVNGTSAYIYSAWSPISVPS